MTASPPPSPDTALLERLERALAGTYDVESEIGRGGMGIVYRGRDPRLKRGVAVKLLPPDLAFRADIRSRFLREAEMAARLSHPNIVPIYAVDERDGLVYFVMALVEGESVGDRVRRTGALPVADARRILREVADALGYAHARGVVHRDVKPDNILLEAPTGRAMVTDFGIARAASEGESRLTATGAAIGTPAYMSPEQCAGERELDGRSDLYSLGAVAYQMLTGEPPFAGGTTPAIMMKQVMERPTPVRERRADVPADLAAIVMRLLEKNPANRFPDGATVVAALDGAPLAPLAPLAEVAEVGEPRVDRLAEQYGREIVGRVVADALTRAQTRKLRREARGEPRSLADRVRGFRRQLVSSAGTTVFLFGINAMTSGPHGFWWAVFPALGMGLNLVRQGGGLWADGVRIGDIFRGSPLPSSDTQQLAGAPAAATVPAPSGATAADVSDEVLAGPHGPVARRAKVDRRAVKDSLARLGDGERKLIPDVSETAEALYQRIIALAAALHQLDNDIAPDRLPGLEERIAQIERSAEGAGDRERRLTLLRRQRDMLVDLIRSRDALLEQYESAGLLLQNLALDLLKVRSSGLQSALDGITSVTQQAQAVAREIDYAVGAADELRAMQERSGTGR